MLGTRYRCFIKRYCFKTAIIIWSKQLGKIYKFYTQIRITLSKTYTIENFTTYAAFDDCFNISTKIFSFSFNKILNLFSYTILDENYKKYRYILMGYWYGNMYGFITKYWKSYDKIIYLKYFWGSSKKIQN